MERTPGSDLHGARRGDYVGPVENTAPNPDGYWWGMVLTSAGWQHHQEIGREATMKSMQRHINQGEGR